MYIIIPNLGDISITFTEWDSAILEAERVTSYFYRCGYEIERKNPSKEECDEKGYVCYAIYNYESSIIIKKLISNKTTNQN